MALPAYSPAWNIHRTEEMLLVPGIRATSNQRSTIPIRPPDHLRHLPGLGLHPGMFSVVADTGGTVGEKGHRLGQAVLMRRRPWPLRPPRSAIAGGRAPPDVIMVAVPLYPPFRLS